jgi:hypothetical protein|tara:strand:+ start:532 stop:732 length:201 start_codon:yes stop_codon:yes gene_type:complete
MNDDLLKDWSINQGTRFLVYKAGTPDEELYTDLEGKPGLITIYCMLGKELWGAGSLGEGDLVEGLI